MVLTYMYYLNGDFMPLMACLNFSTILFVMGLVGMVWNKKNLLLMLLCIELMFFAISLNFIFFSMYMFNPIGQIFCLLVITVAAAETAMGLSLLVILLSLGNKITYNVMMTLRN